MMMDIIGESSTKDLMESHDERKAPSFGEESFSCKANITDCADRVSEGSHLEGESASEEKDKINEPQLSSSRWTNLARVFRLGLALDADITQNISASDMGIVPPQSLTSMQKRASLRRLFRQGSVSRPTSPEESIERSKMDDTKSECDKKESIETHQQSKKGAIWRLFKHGKSSNCTNESQLSDLSGPCNDEGGKAYESKRSLIGRAMKQKNFDAKNSGFQNEDSPSLESQEIPSPHLRGRSLGKFFRHNRDFRKEDINVEKQKHI